MAATKSPKKNDRSKTAAELLAAVSIFRSLATEDLQIKYGYLPLTGAKRRAYDAEIQNHLADVERRQNGATPDLLDDVATHAIQAITPRKLELSPAAALMDIAEKAIKAKQLLTGKPTDIIAEVPTIELTPEIKQLLIAIEATI